MCFYQTIMDFSYGGGVHELHVIMITHLLDLQMIQSDLRTSEGP